MRRWKSRPLRRGSPLLWIAGPCVIESATTRFPLPTVRPSLPPNTVCRSSWRVPLTGEPLVRQVVPWAGPGRGAAGPRRGKAQDRLAGHNRRPRGRPGGPGGGNRRPDSNPGLPRPTDRPVVGRRANGQGGECKEGPVHGALGHAQRGRQDGRGRQPEPVAYGARLDVRSATANDMRAIPWMRDLGRRDFRHAGVQTPGSQGIGPAAIGAWCPSAAAVAAGAIGVHRNAPAAGLSRTAAPI